MRQDSQYLTRIARQSSLNNTGGEISGLKKSSKKTRNRTISLLFRIFLLACRRANAARRGLIIPSAMEDFSGGRYSEPLRSDDPNKGNPVGVTLSLYLLPEIRAAVDLTPWNKEKTMNALSLQNPSVPAIHLAKSILVKTLKKDYICIHKSPSLRSSSYSESNSEHSTKIHDHRIDRRISFGGDIVSLKGSCPEGMVALTPSLYLLGKIAAVVRYLRSRRGIMSHSLSLQKRPALSVLLAKLEKKRYAFIDKSPPVGYHVVWESSSTNSTRSSPPLIINLYSLGGDIVNPAESLTAGMVLYSPPLYLLRGKIAAVNKKLKKEER